ncbi:MAG TPA: HAD-IB family hydrolase [Polyangia bacterium]|jgi:HAD superfamily hydrolase (TIGR01490 family)|nr:HAD-IB family hydrolase [Polyangia bacterium]
MPHPDGNSPSPTTSREAPLRRAAFYDVDGTLIRTNIVHAFAWYARHQPTLTGSLAMTVSTALSVPLFAAADKLSRKAFNELFYRYYRGQSEDRLVLLAEQLFEDVIRPSIFPRAPELIAESRRTGCLQVIVTGGLDFTVRPLARYLGMDDFIANRLEYTDGYANGRLAKPFVAGATKAEIMRDYAARHGIDLARCWAYSDSYSDYPMLAVVGHPTAVNPDFRLRSTARSYDWPILDLG